MAYTFPLSPLGFAGGRLGSCVFSLQTFAASASGRHEQSHHWANSPSGFGAAEGHSFCPATLRASALLCHKQPSSSLPPHHFLEHFQPPGKEPVMRGGKRGGRRMRGLDGYTGSDPDVSTGGGGVMLCLFLTLCSDRDRSTENGWKVSGGRSELEMDTAFLQAAGIQRKTCSV